MTFFDDLAWLFSRFDRLCHRLLGLSDDTRGAGLVGLDKSLLALRNFHWRMLHTLHIGDDRVLPLERQHLEFLLRCHVLALRRRQRLLWHVSVDLRLGDLLLRLSDHLVECCELASLRLLSILQYLRVELGRVDVLCHLDTLDL